MELNLTNIIILVEVPFFLIAAWLAFRAYQNMKGGSFGRGMKWLVVAMVLMAIAHIHLMIMRITGVALFLYIFGDVLGTILLGVYLVIVWIFFILGFKEFLRKQ